MEIDKLRRIERHLDEAMDAIGDAEKVTTGENAAFDEPLAALNLMARQIRGKVARAIADIYAPVPVQEPPKEDKPAKKSFATKLRQK